MEEVPGDGEVECLLERLERRVDIASLERGEAPNPPCDGEGRSALQRRSSSLELIGEEIGVRHTPKTHERLSEITEISILPGRRSRLPDWPLAASRVGRARRRSSRG